MGLFFGILIAADQERSSIMGVASATSDEEHPCLGAETLVNMPNVSLICDHVARVPMNPTRQMLDESDSHAPLATATSWIKSHANTSLN